MADSKISALSAASALAGTEVLPCVQSGSTVKVTPDQIATRVSAALGLGTAATTAATAYATAAQGVTADAAAPAFAAVNAQTGTSYSLQASDNRKIVTLSNAGAITLTVPASLGVGFNCTLVQLGAGQVNVVASSTTVNSRGALTHIAGQYGSAALAAYAANVFALSGDLA